MAAIAAGRGLNINSAPVAILSPCSNIVVKSYASLADIPKLGCCGTIPWLRSYAMGGYVYVLDPYVLCALQGVLSLSRKEHSQHLNGHSSKEVATPHRHRDSVFDLLWRKTPNLPPNVAIQPMGTRKTSKSSDGRRVSIFTVFAVRGMGIRK